MKSKLVFIYTIPRPSAVMMHEHRNDSSGRAIGRTKFGNAKDTIRCLYDPKIGGLNNYISYTPWVDHSTGEIKKDPVTGRELTLQDMMEEKWGKPKGYFTNLPYIKGDSLEEKDLTFYQKFGYKMSDGATVLNLSKMEDELAYYMCLASHLVANSETEWKQHRWPKAQYFIALENEAEEMKYTRNQIKSQAYAKLHNIDFTPTYKRKFVSILGLVRTDTPLTDEATQNLLFDYIDKSGFTANSNIDKFNRLFNKLSTPTGREEVEAQYLLNQALDKRIVFEKQGTYTFITPEGQVVLGDRLNDAIEFILNPKKDKEVTDLRNAIENKK